MIDWRQLFNWIVEHGITYVFGLLSAWIVMRWQRTRDAKKEAHDQQLQIYLQMEARLAEDRRRDLDDLKQQINRR